MNISGPIPQSNVFMLQWGDTLQLLKMLENFQTPTKKVTYTVKHNMLIFIR